MDIKQLRYFLGILEAKSITRAAEVLHMAQPAIGMQLRKLEEELGVKLVVRHSRGIVPTEAGERLRAHAENILEGLAVARQDILDIGTEHRGRITVGMTMTALHLLFAPIIRKFQQKYPAVSLICSEGVSDRLSKSLVTDELDIVFTYSPPTDPEFVAEALAVESQCLAVPIAHPLARASGVTLREALACELVVTSPFTLQRIRIEEAARMYGAPLRIACEVNSVPAIREFVYNGLGCAISPYGAMISDVEDGRIAMLPIKEDDLCRTLYVACSKMRRNSIVFDAVFREVRPIVDGIIEAGKVGWTAPSKGARTRTRA